MSEESEGARERKWELVISALLESPSIQKAAIRCELAESTIDRMLKDPEFCRRYRAARLQVVEQSISVLQRLSTTAAATLGEMLKSRDENVRVRAACAILDRAHRGVEVLDIESRLAAIEARLPPEEAR